MDTPQTQITISIPSSDLRRVPDQRLALYWQLAQANPAPIEDRDAGELAMHIGWEIIRRWMGQVEPPLHSHQQRHYWWSNLTKFARFVDGEWQAKASTGPFCSEHQVPLAGGRCRPCENAEVRRAHVRRWQDDGTWMCVACTEQQGAPIMWPCLVLRAVDVAEDVLSADAGLRRTPPPVPDAVAAEWHAPAPIGSGTRGAPLCGAIGGRTLLNPADASCSACLAMMAEQVQAAPDVAQATAAGEDRHAMWPDGKHAPRCGATGHVALFIADVTCPPCLKLLAEQLLGTDPRVAGYTDDQIAGLACAACGEAFAEGEATAPAGVVLDGGGLIVDDGSQRAHPDCLTSSTPTEPPGDAP